MRESGERRRESDKRMSEDVMTAENDNDLHGTFDAQVWAQRFVRRVTEKPTIATDEMTMVAWFAGAIMAGYDHAKRGEWSAGVADAVCFVSACDYTDIDVRGPVRLRNDPTLYYACTEHWEAIIGILGRQVTSDDASRWSPELEDEVGA